MTSNDRLTFTAIDFETACHNRASICQIGLVRVEGGKIAKELDILVQPPENYYHPIFSTIHGIEPHMTANEPPFWHVWEWIEPYIRNQTVVAHNIAFDGSCLTAAWERVGLAPVTYQAQCTYRIFKKSLNVLCEMHGIQLDHHNALSDALACANLYLYHLNSRG
jgi:DNA polymerase-3 subunit epsilon